METEKKLSKPTSRTNVLVRGKLWCKNNGGREEQRGENEDDGNGCECFVKRKRVMVKIRGQEVPEEDELNMAQDEVHGGECS